MDFIQRTAAFLVVVFFGASLSSFAGPPLPDPPPALRPPQGESALLQPATGISLTRDERELATLMLDGSFGTDAQAVLAFDKLVNTIRDYSPGRLFDLSQSLRKEAKDSVSLFKDSLFAGSAAEGGLRERLNTALLGVAPDLITEGGPGYDKISRLLSLVKVRPEDVLEKIEPEDKVRFVRRFESYFHSQFLKIEDLASTLIQSGLMKISDPQTELFVKTVFKNYFSRLSVDSKKNMLKELITLPATATLGDQASVILHRAGPQFQKFLQIIAREPDLDPEAQRLLVSLEKSVKPAEFSEIHEHLVRQIPEHYPTRFTAIDRFALGSGTMSQIHRADVAINSGFSKRVVVRMLRPGIEERVQQDYKIFSEIAEVVSKSPEFKGTRYESLGQIVDGLNRAVRDELDVFKTVTQQNDGRSAYSSTHKAKVAGRVTQIEILVPEIFHAETAKNGILLMEQAEGVSLPEFFRHDPQARSAVVEEIVGVWLREAIFKGGFFHGDLHQGNLLIHRTEEGIIRVSILDFGMAGRLTPEQRAAFLVMESAFQSRDAKLLERTVRSLLDGKQIDPDLSQKISTAIANELQEVLPSTQHLMEALLRIQAPLPNNFIAFSRGMVMVDQMLRWSGSKKTLADVATRAARKELAFGLPRNVIRKILNIAGEEGAARAPTDRALLRLFWDQVRAACSVRGIRSFLKLPH